MSGTCDFLQGVCIFQQTIANYLLTGKFYNEELADLIKETGDIKVLAYDAQADETARALVTMRRDTITLNTIPTMNYGVDHVSYKPALSIIITISSQSYALTEKLGAELLQYIAVISKAMGSYNLNIGSIRLSPTTNSPQSPNYFINTISVGCTIPQVLWKMQSDDDILSTLKLNIKFDGQNILA